jgi:predicted RNA-binding Zn-ribbon protein involved in translation (DUF1610 family)
MNPETKDAERVRKPKLPKNRLLRKLRKKSKRASDGGQKIKSKRTGHMRSVTFCPKCGSTDLFWASGLPHLWSVWECKNCGYRGAFVVKNGELAEKVREDYARRTAKQ